MATVTRFNFGLAKHGFIPTALSFLGVGISALVGVGLRDAPTWVPLLAAGAAFTLSLLISLRIAGTSVVVTEDGIIIHRAGRIGPGLQIPYDQIRTVEPILGASRVAIVTKDGGVTWIGPFQVWDFINGPNRLLDLVSIVQQHL
jgi:hypothetical protein